MIAYLRGKLALKEPTHLIVDVQGIGYHVNISLNTYSEIKDKEDIFIHTYLHIKEDSHTIFGFTEENEKKMFLSLLSISGVGPNTALMIQSSLTASELQNAIIHENVKTIQSVKGVGGKTAQRIILELKDKMIKMGLIAEPEKIGSGGYNTLKNEALSALMTLGIAKNAAEKSVDGILKNSGNTITLEELIKLALKNA